MKSIVSLPLFSFICVSNNDSSFYIVCCIGNRTQEGLRLLIVLYNFHLHSLEIVIKDVRQGPVASVQSQVDLYQFVCRYIV